MSPPVRPEVTIVYGRGCPNLPRARQRLRAALRAAGWPVRWREWERESPETPRFARGYGSPTVLVGGRDVAPGNDGEARVDRRARTGGTGPSADRCRLYPDETGALDGVPPLRAIAEALAAAERAAGNAE